ncbi:MAG: 2-oxoacid:ferredoxin oxidoreductase subunit beta, partial [Sulfolobaceae archaeon]|nr:2-oxoacid:ferredoxin oxidoreductase subunit beta [Sulfolobaceae archaeon]
SRALLRSQEFGDRIPIGVFYQNELVPTYEARINQRAPSYLQNPPYKQQIIVNNKLTTLVDDLLKEKEVD